ncbi:TetR family transcriptional regulator, partial [Kitasatospora sp. NPDC058263]
MRACAELAAELTGRGLPTDIVRAAIRNVFVGTALDYPPSDANPYTRSVLEEIAAEAQVAIGTLYRHLPTRAALVEAATRDG